MAETEITGESVTLGADVNRALGADLLKQFDDLAENLAEESIRQDDIKQRENEHQLECSPQE